MNITKKIAVLLTAAAAALSMAVFPVYAEEDEETEEEYRISEEGSSVSEDSLTQSGDYRYYTKTGNYGDEVAVLEEYVGSDTDIVIPEEIDGFKVEALGNRTFADNHKVTSITIPSGLEDFGIYPFYGCTSLMEFKVSEKNELYKADKDGALVGIHGWSIVAYPTGKDPVSYNVPEDVVLIGASAFAMCENLKEVTFPDSLETIGSFAFSECTSLEAVVLPENVTELERFAFSGCTALKDVKLNENLNVIGDAAFFKCKALETIDFPDSVHQVGQAAFCATGLTSVKIPDTVVSIGYSAFGFETDLTDQIVQNESFVIQGYKNSYAERYCSENDMIFSELEEEETQAAESDEEVKNSSKKKLSPGTIAGIIIAAAAAVTAVVTIVITKGRKKGGDSDDTADNGDDREES